MKLTQAQFRSNVAFWLASYAISPEVLDGPKLKLPLKQKDPVWVHEQLRRDPLCASICTDAALLELMLCAKKVP